jgi:hypothetical protein
MKNISTIRIQVDNHVWSQAVLQVGGQALQQVVDQVWDQVGNQVNDQVYEK